MADKYFTTGQAAKLTGINYNRVIQYLHKGQVNPISPSKGQGRAAKLSRKDIIKLIIVTRLSDSGHSAKVAGVIAEEALETFERVKRPEFVLAPGLTLIISLDQIWEEVFGE